MATGLENLWIYQLAEDLEVGVYEVTKSFPKDEIFRSVDQLRRSSTSASDNINEGYHKGTLKEKLRFFTISKGEAEETKRKLIKSARKKFLSFETATQIAEEYTVLIKGISGYMRFLRLNELDDHTLRSKPKKPNN